MFPNSTICQLPLLFREVANLLADVFDDDDFVPTDIAAALLLLYEQHHRNSSGVRWGDF